MKIDKKELLEFEKMLDVFDYFYLVKTFISGYFYIDYSILVKFINNLNVEEKYVLLKFIRDLNH